MRRSRRKKEFKNIEIVDFAHKGHAIGRKEDGEVIIVEEVVPGDVVDVITIKKKKGLWHAKPTHWSVKSAFRTDPLCAHFGSCGGCKWQHVNYQEQLHFKQKAVSDAMRRIGGFENVKVNDIIASSKIFAYRNKMEYSFSNKRWLTQAEIERNSDVGDRRALGLHPPRYFDRVVDLNHCHLQDTIANEIRNFVRKCTSSTGYSYYDQKSHEGWLRSLVIRQGSFTGDIMVNIVFGYEHDEIIPLCEQIHREFEDISSINYCINTKLNDSTYDLEFIPVIGPGYIEERVNHAIYRIGPKSFFQTNTYQAQKMFECIKRLALQESFSTVYDLYCGAGSIGLYLAQPGHTIVGIEEVAEAIDQAKINQEINGLSNCNFYVGDVKALFDEDLLRRHGQPELVIVDPPRAGMHQQVTESLLKVGATRIIYVSCNPSTQARDLKILAKNYTILEHQPIDMFPHTYHTENITLLKSKQ